MAERRFSDRKLQCGIAILALLAGAAAAAQTSVGRGARDPVRATVIVGSEGKGLFIGAGIPEGNTPIFAAKDGAVTPQLIAAIRAYESSRGAVDGRIDPGDATMVALNAIALSEFEGITDFLELLKNWG